MDVATFIAATGCSRTLALRWSSQISAAMREYAINTPTRQAMFLANVGHESGGFQFVREIWGPTEPQKRYEGRADLGNTRPGDGRRFLGRGLIQITGRANYEACGQALGLDLIVKPELLEEPEWAARSAGWYWASRALNEVADRGEFSRVVQVINGGLNGYADRIARWQRAARVLESNS